MREGWLDRGVGLKAEFLWLKSEQTHTEERLIRRRQRRRNDPSRSSSRKTAAPGIPARQLVARCSGCATPVVQIGSRHSRGPTFASLFPLG
jgi:hypothetical protein